MIDTDKYEGHTPGPWKPLQINQINGGCWTLGNLGVQWEEPDKQLIADAPLLLEEVKWLRSLIEMISYDLEWHPELFEQNKRQLAYNVRKWNGEEE